jgi:hypothetical protein
MEVQTKEGEEIFIFTISSPGSSYHGSASASASAGTSSSSSSSGERSEATYIPIRSKVEMRKLAEGTPHEALITRSNQDDI